MSGKLGCVCVCLFCRDKCQCVENEVKMVNNECLCMFYTQLKTIEMSKIIGRALLLTVQRMLCAGGERFVCK